MNYARKMTADQSTWPNGHETIPDMADKPPPEMTPELAEALAGFETKQQELAEARDNLRAKVAGYLKERDEVTADAIAELLPWSGETVRGIAREYGVPLKRKPTVRSIKPQRRKG